MPLGPPSTTTRSPFGVVTRMASPCPTSSTLTCSSPGPIAGQTPPATIAAMSAPAPLISAAVRSVRAMPPRASGGTGARRGARWR